MGRLPRPCLPAARQPLPPGGLTRPAIQQGTGAADGISAATGSAGILIVEGSVSGLCAGGWHAAASVDDFTVLEMESRAGRQTRAPGQSPRHLPVGRHYLPPPPRSGVPHPCPGTGRAAGNGRQTALRRTFSVCDAAGTVYRHSLWKQALLPRISGYLPKTGAAALSEQMQALKRARGAYWPDRFAIPMNVSRDPAWLALDRISFRQWLLDNGFTAPTLHWLANYACRDDYGMDYAQTSAWAGLHYFACRTGKRPMRRPIPCSPPRMATPGWHADLAGRCGERIVTGAMACRVDESKHAVAVDVLVGEQMVRYEAQQLVWAAPLFILPRLWSAMPAALRGSCAGRRLCAWLTANLHLSAWPEERYGAVPALGWRCSTTAPAWAT